MRMAYWMGGYIDIRRTDDFFAACYFTTMLLDSIESEDKTVDK
jgi:hypothetical protein